MVEYLLSRDAELDLQDIYKQGLELFGEVQADKYLDEIYHVFDLLLDSPQIGVNFKVRKLRVQKYIHKSHIIVFQDIGNDVKILRVFHGKSEYLAQL